MTPPRSEPWRLELGQVTDWLNSNQRLHRYEEARRTREWRTAAKDAAIQHGGYLVGRVRIIVTIHKTRAGKWDAGNLYPTAKAIVDGLVDAGVLVDDSNEHVIGPDMRAGDKAPVARVVIEIHELEEWAA